MGKYYVSTRFCISMALGVLPLIFGLGAVQFGMTAPSIMALLSFQFQAAEYNFLYSFTLVSLSRNHYMLKESLFPRTFRWRYHFSYNSYNGFRVRISTKPAPTFCNVCYPFFPCSYNCNNITGFRFRWSHHSRFILSIFGGCQVQKTQKISVDGSNHEVQIEFIEN